MDSSCILWIDFRNQRWDFHVVHSFHGEIKQMGKLSKWGNYFGIVNTILSGAIDYILGNKAAIIISIIAFLFAFVTNYIGYGGKMNLLAYVTTIAFALSLIANALNALAMRDSGAFG